MRTVIVFFPVRFRLSRPHFQPTPKIKQRFKTGKGLERDQHDHRLLEGTERFFRPNYLGNLVTNRIRPLDGVEAKIKGVAKVADADCGFGASTVIMTKAYPTSTFS